MELPTHDQLDKLFLKAGTEFTLDGVHCVYVKSDDALDDFMKGEFDARRYVYAGYACRGCPRMEQREARGITAFTESTLCSPCHGAPLDLFILTFEMWQRFQLLKE